MVDIDGSVRMDQEKIGRLIREIRKKNHLTQAEFAKKYGVTFQAVSKWENGKNIPDVALLKQISQDFDIDIGEMLEGKITTHFNRNRHRRVIFWLLGILAFLLILFVICYSTRNSDFEFKTLSTSCQEFTISGSIAYNDEKSSIYISNIDYCGGEDNVYYSEIECILYESFGQFDTKISTYYYQELESIRLEDFLKDVVFHIDNYSRNCKSYSENSLYLQINATDEKGTITSYLVPLTLSDNCN